MSTHQEEFLTKARDIHGTKYSYDNVEYISARSKVSITCPIHGEFSQSPYSHVYLKTGCPRCAVEARNKSLRSTTEEFVKKAKIAHGDRYDYSKVDYKNNSAHVTIGCNEHGVFSQTPNSHLHGRGCPHCGGKVKLSTEHFINKAKEVHGDKYDYSRVNYLSAKTPVEIICPIHGPFTQIPNNHTQGAGCYYCVERVIASTEEFVERARKIHGDKYDYSKVNYVDAISKVTIGCKSHGDFEQQAGEHLRGRGCKRCRDEYTGKLNTSTTEEFLIKARATHGDRYDYTRVDYVAAKKLVKIICPKHGIFEQKPVNHLKGCGCPICSSSKGEIAISELLSKLGYSFVQEYIIPNQNSKFRYDFYVKDLNLLIEYHGIQHYEAIDFFGGREGLIQTKLRDSMKKTLAKILKYRFLEINYTQFLNHSREDFEKKLMVNLEKFKSSQQ